MENNKIQLRLSITEDQLDIIENLSACNYSYKHIALYLEMPLEFFIDEVTDPSSAAYIRYTKGKLHSNYVIDQKLKENAEKGNVTAIQQLEKIKNSRFIENTITKFFS